MSELGQLTCICTHHSSIALHSRKFDDIQTVSKSLCSLCLLLVDVDAGSCCQVFCFGNPVQQMCDLLLSVFFLHLIYIGYRVR